LATLDTLGDFQGFAGDETPKVANSLKGHVSGSTAEELYPELPDFLDRRARA
jgi:hypothetical protein